MNAPVRDPDVQEVSLLTDGVPLGGFLGVPEAPRGLVIFAHGSGSSRFSSRNNAVARDLRACALATLLFDLLTDTESRDRARVFDIVLLARRLGAATRWAMDDPRTQGLAVGYFGASTGAAAALAAAAEPGAAIGAVVSRGGRPDLAAPLLDRVTAPTLLIVGGHDEQVRALNESAQARMKAPCDLVVVPGATHLFEEPGAMERVSELAGQWFVAHLAGRA